MYNVWMKNKELSGKEKYELKRQGGAQQKKASGQKGNFNKNFKKSIPWLVGFAVAGLVIYVVVSAPDISEEDLVSTAGIHIHPQLTILINGERQVVSGNIGLVGNIQAGVHTHATDGVLHFEKAGVVLQDDLRLDEFFDSWGEQFNSECILDSCNGPDGTVRMTVNGRENSEFENYIVRDGDSIEIRYE